MLLQKKFGKIPNKGDIFIYDGLKITVTKTDFRRVLEIHVLVLNKDGYE